MILFPYLLERNGSVDIWPRDTKTVPCQWARVWGAAGRGARGGAAVDVRMPVAPVEQQVTHNCGDCAKINRKYRNSQVTNFFVAVFRALVLTEPSLAISWSDFDPSMTYFFISCYSCTSVVYYSMNKTTCTILWNE